MFDASPPSDPFEDDHGQSPAAAEPTRSGPPTDRVPPADPQSLLDTALGALRALAASDPTPIDDGSLCSMSLDLEQARRFLDAAVAHAVAELDTRGTTDAEFGLVTSRWLAREALLPVRVGKERVRVARKLRLALPTVDHALQAGAIGWDHARTLADAANPRIVAGFDAVVPGLLERVPTTRFDVWRRRVLETADALDQDGAHDPRGDEPASRLMLRSTIAGLLDLRGVLGGADALLVEQSLVPLADELHLRYRRDHESNPEIEVPGRAELLGEALVELCRRSRLAGDGRTTPEVTLVLDAAEPLPRLRAPEDSQIAVLPRSHADRLLCDAAFAAVVLDSLGMPVDLGRSVRYATHAQRRAMARRDGGCVFPGCDAPAAWCDAHHVLPWDDGGTTDVAQMASLCRHHHRISHRAGWEMHRTDDGWYWWRAPGGRTFWSQRHGQQRAGPTPEAPKPGGTGPPPPAHPGP